MYDLFRCGLLYLLCQGDMLGNGGREWNDSLQTARICGSEYKLGKGMKRESLIIG